jgi:predicted hydrolase (HD superfamily)
MSVNRDQAWQQLCAWTETDSLRKHARAVEIVMDRAHDRYGADAATTREQWAVAGMLHDADYEKWPRDHPNRIVAWLREQGELEIAHAVSAHHTGWDVPYETPLDRALIACDELTGFVVACCLVRPDGVHSLTAKSVKKKLKDLRFAAKVDRSEVDAGITLLGADPAEHIAFVIEALRDHASELGIEGHGSG